MLKEMGHQDLLDRLKAEEKEEKKKQEEEKKKDEPHFSPRKTRGKDPKPESSAADVSDKN